MNSAGFLPTKTKPSEFDSFYENIEWIKALVDWDKGHKTSLAQMLTYMRPPVEFMPIIADIVEGNRKSSNKGQSGRTRKPSETLKIALEIERAVGGMKYLSKGEGLEHLENYLSANGVKRNGEAIDLHHAYEKQAVVWRELIAKKHDISIHTAIKYEKDLKKLKENWPQI